MSKGILYIKGDKNVEVKKPEVTLGDILSMECSDEAVSARVKALRLFRISEKGKMQRRYVVSILKIMECIHQSLPGLEIQNEGAPDIIITYEEQKTPGQFMHLLKTAVVAVIVFFGAAFSIMAFNNDVSTTKLFSQIYELLTGQKSSGFTILEVTYSLGLVIGILVFFNHFGKKRFSVDPTPIEVEMRLYENDIQTTLIENYSRKEKEIDVDQTTSTGNSRS
ncbi:MAG: stage V sporulation protein AA [Hespellia sp.]|nr:stage V sporulation protein AA [Hespellia sp.]